ncbi:MAG: hypothetical protein LZF86_10176 [Nitrospira sp.]|nr:MAG: hypothetical protein LZF86_10176 [Nitrospira sp.]
MREGRHRLIGRYLTPTNGLLPGLRCEIPQANPIKWRSM